MAKKKRAARKTSPPPSTDRDGPPRDVHYEEIRVKNRKFREAYNDWNSAKQRAAELKKRHERIGAELTELISRGPNPQLELPFGSYDWQMRPLDALGLPDGILEKLEEGGITNIGELQQHWADGKYLDEIEGIGNENAALIADAFADYGAKHPEIFGEQEP